MTNTHYSHSSGLQACVTILSSDLTVYLLFLPFKPTKLLSLWNVWLEKCCTWVTATFKTLLGPLHWLSGPGSVMYVCVVLSVFLPEGCLYPQDGTYRPQEPSFQMLSVTIQSVLMLHFISSEFSTTTKSHNYTLFHMSRCPVWHEQQRAK